MAAESQAEKEEDAGPFQATARVSGKLEHAGTGTRASSILHDYIAAVAVTFGNKARRARTLALRYHLARDFYDWRLQRILRFRNPSLLCSCLTILANLLRLF